MPGMKKAIFCKRIVAFNENFAPVGGTMNGKAICVLWHDAIRGRTAEDVGSVFLAFVRRLQDINSITLWLDNCSAQGKNWWLYTALVYEVKSQEILIE